MSGFTGLMNEKENWNKSFHLVISQILASYEWITYHGLCSEK